MTLVFSSINTRLLSPVTISWVEYSERMANFIYCLSLFLIVLVLCTYQSDATFGSRYYSKCINL